MAKIRKGKVGGEGGVGGVEREGKVERREMVEGGEEREEERKHCIHNFNHQRDTEKNTRKHKKNA